MILSENGKRGELLSKLDKDGCLATYGYTEKGDISRIQYADGRTVTYSYDESSRYLYGNQEEILNKSAI